MRVFFTFSALAFLYRLRRILTRFPPYGVTMRVFYSRFCIVLDVFRVFLRIGFIMRVFHRFICIVWPYGFPPYCVTMRVFFTFFCTRVSLSFKTTLRVFLCNGITMRLFYWRFCIDLDVFLRFHRLGS